METSYWVIYSEFLVESQDVVSCFAENPSCEGTSVNRFRFWILQEAMLEAKLNICPDVNYKSLKDRIENTGKWNRNIIAQKVNLRPNCI